jgi:hypothetical protein
MSWCSVKAQGQRYVNMIEKLVPLLIYAQLGTPILNEGRMFRVAREQIAEEHIWT